MISTNFAVCGTIVRQHLRKGRVLVKKFFSLVTAAILSLCAVTAPVFAEDATAVQQAPTINNRFYYDQLSANEKTFYDRALEAIENGIDTVYFADLGLDNVSAKRIYNALMKDSYLFNQIYMFGGVRYWDDINGNITMLNFDFNASDSASPAARMEFENRTARIVEEANKKPTDYEKLKFIHDWIADNTEYLDDDTIDDIRTVNGPILNGIAVCAGYALAFQYLAQSLGFDCIYVTGLGNEGDAVRHGWNMVKLDGEWYNVDVTWDDGNRVKYTYFLKGEETFTASGTEHIPDSGYTYPKARRDYAPSKSVFSVVLTVLPVLAGVTFVVLVFRLHRNR